MYLPSFSFSLSCLSSPLSFSPLDFSPFPLFCYPIFYPPFHTFYFPYPSSLEGGRSQKGEESSVKLSKFSCCTLIFLERNFTELHYLPWEINEHNIPAKILQNNRNNAWFRVTQPQESLSSAAIRLHLLTLDLTGSATPLRSFSEWSS